MINFELFEKTINVIKEQEDKDKKIQDLMCDGIITYSCDITSVCVKLLESSFNDDDEWVSWWIWDCDYGQKRARYWPKGFDVNEEGIDISNIKDFYNFLINIDEED